VHFMLEFSNTIFSPGITNGIDIYEWNPSSDKHVASNYSVDDLSGKVVTSHFRYQLFWNIVSLPATLQVAGSV